MGSVSVSVIVPAYNAELTLPACLDAIGKLTYPVAEVIVYSDGSTDRTEAIAAAAGAIILRNDGPPLGPAKGRNEGSKIATSDLLLFVDADVVMSPDCLALLVADHGANRAMASFGSYDDAPRSRRITSLYANLRHHFVHQHSSRDASTFWSGVGLMDRRVFTEMGGYDALSYAHPSIEDIELGVRLVAAGHKIRLVPEALATHWKDWSLWRVWHTDVVRRAYPWSMLIASGRTAGADLNVSTRERLKAVAALLALLMLLIGVIKPIFLFGAVASLALYVGLNAAFFGFLFRRLELPGAIAAMLMHWCYHLYSTATYCLVAMRLRLGLAGVARQA